MPTIDEILKKYNRGKEEEDKVKYASQIDLTTTFISTGSPKIDSLCGGHATTGMTLVTGWESSGKSSIMLKAIAEAQKAYPDKVAILMDGEGTVSEDYLFRMGVDSSRLVMDKDKNLESMLDKVEAFSRADDVSIICIDSVKSFFSSVDEAKSAEEYTIGTVAKRWNTRMPIISSNCFRRKIPILIIHQWRQDPGKMMGDNRVLSGGQWVKYMPDLHLDLSKGQVIKNEDGYAIGHKLNVRVKKSKHSSYNPKEVHEVNFYYEGGFNEVDETFNKLVDSGVIDKAGGGNFSFTMQDGEVFKMKGQDNLIDYLKTETDVYDYLKDQLV